MKFTYLRAKLEKILLVIILFLFGSIFSLISLVNHYLFRTAALDLGMFNQALYSFAHLKQNFYTLAPDGIPVNFFGDHFSPITLFYTPFYYLFGTYTLLIIQIFFVLAGGYGVYKLAQTKFNSKYLPLLVIVQFFLIWGIYSALSYDFHNNVVGAMMVPCLVFFYMREKKFLTILVFSLILVTKENMAVWLVFIFLALMVRGGISSWRKYIRFEIPLILLACIYFAIIVGVVMPALDSSTAPVSYQLLRYSNIGNSPTDIAINIVTHPLDTVKTFFDTKSDGGYFIGKKTELHFMVLVSGGISFLFAPYYLIALIPIYLQKFLTNVPMFWGTTLQYSIEFVPIISLAFIDFLSKINRRKPEYVTVAALAIPLIMLIAYCGGYYVISSAKVNAPSTLNAMLFSKEHYQSPHNISETYRALDLIPENAILSASSLLAPHLSFRDNIYLFPNVKDAEYIALFTDNTYFTPSDNESNDVNFTAEIQKYLNSPDYETIYNNDDLIIIKRKNIGN